MTGHHLLLPIPLRTDEGALPYLSRLAAANGIPGAKSFCADWELDFDRLVDGCPGELGRLAELSGVPAPGLVSASIRKEGGTFHVRGERMVATAVRRNRFVVCPACLKGDVEASADLPPDAAAYGRLTWSIGGIGTCEAHGLALVDLGSGSRSAKDDFSAVVRPYLKRLEEMVGTSLRRPASELERYVVRRLDGAGRDGCFLDDLDLHVAIRFCEVIGALAVHGRGVHLKRIDEAELYLAGSVGIAIAAGGEEALQGFLRGLRRGYPFGYRVHSGPRSPFQELRAWLTGRSREEAYAPVRALLARHLADPKPVDIADKRGRYLGGSAGAAYARIMNGRPRIIRECIPQHCPAGFAMTRPTTASHDAPGTRLVPLPAAARRLGCDLPLILALLAHRILLPAEQDEADWRHRFRTDDLETLLAGMTDGTEEVRERPEGVVDLYVAADQLLTLPIVILRMVLERRLPWIGRWVGAGGVKALLFRLDELRSMVEAGELNGATLPEAAAVLALEPEGIEALLALGAMTKEKGYYALTGVPVEVVPAASIEGFIAANVDLRVLLQRPVLKPAGALAFLSKVGAEPTYADPDGRFTYYDRMSLVGIDPGLRLRRPALSTSRLSRASVR